MKILLLSLFFISSIFASNFEQDVQNLAEGSFQEKIAVISQLSDNNTNDERLILLFDAMLDSKLFYTNANKTLVYLVKEDGDNYYTVDVLSSQKLEVMSKMDFQKVKTNNKLRSVIRNKLAALSLFSKDSEIRLASAKNLLNHFEQDNLPIVNKAISQESDPKIKQTLVEIRTIIQATYSGGQDQKVAITALGNSLSQASLQALEEIASTEDKEIQTLAQKSISTIQGNRSLYAMIEQAFFGLSLGSILLLAALGLSITFGVMKVINMAHGEMIMLGAYTTFTIQKIMPNLMEYSILIAIPAAFVVSAIIGIFIERFVIRHLYGRPLETLLATFGISLILQQIVRSVYSPLNQIVQTPQWMSGAIEINSALSLTYSRLYIIIFAMVVFLGVLFVLKKTSLGLKVRAVTQNRQMAQAMGIKTGWIDAITFGLGSGLAGIAGVALSQLTNVGPNLGQAYIVDSFMVVVFGGVGNLWGTFIGAMTIGELNKILEPGVGAILTKVLILVMIILFIQKKPRGLFPQKGRDAQD
jgi:urea transport system permease protein